MKSLSNRWHGSCLAWELGASFWRSVRYYFTGRTGPYPLLPLRRTRRFFGGSAKP